MTVRIIRHDVPLKLIFALLAGALLVGCQSRPSTQFDWGVRTSFHRTAARQTQQASEYRIDYRDSAVPTPTPRPDTAQPAWYQPHPRETVREEPLPEPTPAPTADVQFIWPLNGRVISSFGETAAGERNDGINIATSEGAPIHAAAAGTVSYAGDELKSYGNLVLIRHDGNYVTAYAHAEKLVVSRGDRVAKGQIIGYAGSTGDVSSPQLHFEIRRGVHPVDPRPLLGSERVASR
jgi:murein DD-endopeptidase MepM/ murein hydrolase activator NlpD